MVQATEKRSRKAQDLRKDELVELAAERSLNETGTKLMFPNRILLYHFQTIPGPDRAPGVGSAASGNDDADAAADSVDDIDVAAERDDEDDDDDFDLKGVKFDDLGSDADDDHFYENDGAGCRCEANLWPRG